MNRDFDNIYENIKNSNIKEIDNIAKKRKIVFLTLVILIILMFIFKDFVLYNDMSFNCHFRNSNKYKSI